MMRALAKVHAGRLLEPVHSDDVREKNPNVMHLMVAQRLVDEQGLLPRTIYRALVWWGRNEGPMPSRHVKVLNQAGVLALDDEDEQWKLVFPHSTSRGKVGS